MVTLVYILAIIQQITFFALGIVAVVVALVSGY